VPRAYEKKLGLGRLKIRKKDLRNSVFRKRA